MSRRFMPLFFLAKVVPSSTCYQGSRMDETLRLSFLQGMMRGHKATDDYAAQQQVLQEHLMQVM